MNLYVKTKKNVKLYVEDLNPKGKHTIFFIHGFPLNHKMWEYIIEYLSEIGYHCISMDLRGYGQSDRPIDGYDYDTMAEDVKSVIDTLKLKDITLVGYSMGGAIAIKYVSKYTAQNVSNLCLLSAAAPSFIETKEWDYGMKQDKLESLIMQTYVSRPDLITIIKSLFFYQFITPEMGQWFDNLALDSAGWATGKSLLALSEERLFEDIKNINIPTLILYGLHDKFCPKEAAIYLKDNIKNSTLIELYMSGHATFFEEKNKVSDSIDKFIRQHISTPTPK